MSGLTNSRFNRGFDDDGDRSSAWRQGRGSGVRSKIWNSGSRG